MFHSSHEQAALERDRRRPRARTWRAARIYGGFHLHWHTFEVVSPAPVAKWVGMAGRHYVGTFCTVQGERPKQHKSGSTTVSQCVKDNFLYLNLINSQRVYGLYESVQRYYNPGVEAF